MVSLLGIFGAVVSAILTFFKWLLDGLVVCIANPVTATVILAVLTIGFYFGVKHDQAALLKLKTEMVQADVDSKKRLRDAEAARKAAEDKVRTEVPAASEPAPAVPAPIKRVRHRAANSSGSWLPSFSSLWGKSK